PHGQVSDEQWADPRLRCCPPPGQPAVHGQDSFVCTNSQADPRRGEKMSGDTRTGSLTRELATANSRTRAYGRTVAQVPCPDLVPRRERSARRGRQRRTWQYVASGTSNRRPGLKAQNPSTARLPPTLRTMSYAISGAAGEDSGPRARQTGASPSGPAPA